MYDRILRNATKRWYILRSARPGERFEKVLDSRWHDRSLDCWALRRRMIAAGLFLALAGVFAGTLSPVLSLSLVALGAMLCARESLKVARWMDAADRRRAAWMETRRITRRRTRGLRQAPPENWVMARAALVGAVAVAILWSASH